MDIPNSTIQTLSRTVTFWTYIWKMLGLNQGCDVICPDCGDPWFLQSLQANARTII